METRTATASDSDAIRDVAARSFRASYSLSPDEIEQLLEIEFETAQLEDRLADEDTLLAVAQQDDTVVGFVEGRLAGEGLGEIHWLHVSPPARGEGAGTQLFEHATAELRERETDEIRALVLAQNQEGSEFFEQFAFEHAGRDDHEIESTTLHVEVFTDAPAEAETESHPVPGEITVEGQTQYLDHEETVSGEEGAFYLVFEDERREEHYGFYCSNCGTFSDSADGLGKVVCEECGNAHNADEWDASYL